MGLGRLRASRWKLWTALGTAALAGWFYAAPITLSKSLRSAAEEPRSADAASLIAARVDFTRVNAQLSGDLRSATNGHLDSQSFARLLLYGWLPQQKRKAADPGTIDRADENNPTEESAPTPGQQTRLYHIRYKSLNRFMAIYWDATQVHEVVLTLERESPFHRWQVTRVFQFNICPYDFDCTLTPSVDIPTVEELARNAKPGAATRAKPASSH